jgi:hypothetical protein
MRNRYYYFTFSNGESKMLTLSEAKEANDELVKKRIEDIIQSFSTKRMKKDGFEPGWQPNINAYAGGRQEYSRLLKERGLVEIGYDYIPQEDVRDHSPCSTKEFIDTAVESGVELSDNEKDAILSGEYFKD